MDASDYAGNSTVGPQRVRNPDLFGRGVAQDDIGLTHLDARTRAELVEAFAQGDRARAVKVLSSWGIRR